MIKFKPYKGTYGDMKNVLDVFHGGRKIGQVLNTPKLGGWSAYSDAEKSVVSDANNKVRYHKTKEIAARTLLGVKEYVEVRGGVGELSEEEKRALVLVEARKRKKPPKDMTIRPQDVKVRRKQPAILGKGGPMRDKRTRVDRKAKHKGRVFDDA